MPFPAPGDLPDPGIKPASLVPPAVAGGLFSTSAAREAPLGTAPVLYSLGPLRKAGPAVSISQISSSLRGMGTDAGKCSPLIPVYSLNIYGAPIVCEALGIKNRAKTPVTLKAVTVEHQRQT